MQNLKVSYHRGGKCLNSCSIRDNACQYRSLQVCHSDHLTGMSRRWMWALAISSHLRKAKISYD